MTPILARRAGAGVNFTALAASRNGKNRAWFTHDGQHDLRRAIVSGTGIGSLCFGFLTAWVLHMLCQTLKR
jgi:hypothetical protein